MHWLSVFATYITLENNYFFPVSVYKQINISHIKQIQACKSMTLLPNHHKDYDFVMFGFLA